MSARFAIYVAPGGDLRAAAEAWLDQGASNARRYGFHATMKAPFRLAPGCTAEDLSTRLAAFAARRHPVVVPALKLARLGRFFALIGDKETDEVRDLACDVVRKFDDLRAPATDADIERRQPERLDDRERELLYAWGYPYVLDRFRFHLTLTDPVPDEQADAVESALRQHFAAQLGRDLVIESLALFTEPEPGRPFVLVSSYPLEAP